MNVSVEKMLSGINYGFIKLIAFPSMGHALDNSSPYQNQIGLESNWPALLSSTSIIYFSFRRVDNARLILIVPKYNEALLCKSPVMFLLSFISSYDLNSYHFYFKKYLIMKCSNIVSSIVCVISQSQIIVIGTEILSRQAYPFGHGWWIPIIWTIFHSLLFAYCAWINGKHLLQLFRQRLTNGLCAVRTDKNVSLILATRQNILVVIQISTIAKHFIDWLLNVSPQQ